jgi:glycosyltransferase involved in cell wall biosynthesis
MIKISIICSNYNSDRWIKEYLNFLENQTDKNFEIIFIDAKSTDSSLNTIKNFASSTSIKTKIIECEEKIGIYAAWNLGIKNCTTEYIMNYNTDDMIYSHAISTYNNALKIHNTADIIYGPCGFVKTRNISDFFYFANWPEYSHEIMMQMCICGPFPLIKKKVFENFGYFNESFISSGDYEMWARLSKNECKFQKISEIIGSFYFRDDSIHQSNSSKARQEDILIQKTYK